MYLVTQDSNCSLNTTDFVFPCFIHFNFFFHILSCILVYSLEEEIFSSKEK